VLDLLRPPRGVRLVLLVVALAGVALVLVASRDGLGTTPDGVSYLGAADNVADGRGLTGAFTTALDPFTPERAVAFDGAVPFIQWPPGYPAVLSVGTVLGVSAADAARLVNALAFGALLALVGWITWSLVGAGRSDRSALGAAVATAVVVVVVGIQPYLALLSVLVASEPLYVVVALAAVWCFVRWVARSSGGPPAVDGLLVGAFALAAAGALTRFVGLSLVGALGVALVLLAGGPIGRRLLVGAGAVAAAAAPALAWTVVVGRQAGTSVRTVVWHPPDEPQWRLAASSIQEWVVPPDASTPWRAVLSVAAALAVLVSAWGWSVVIRSEGRVGLARPWVVTVALALVSYLVVVVATHSLLDRVVPIGQRLFTPIVPLVVITVVVGFAHAVARPTPTPTPTPTEPVDVDARSAPSTSTGSGGSGGSGGRVLGGRVLGAVGLVVVGVVVIGLGGSWWNLAEPGRPWPADPATTPTGAYLNALDDDALIVANDPSLAWQTAERQTIALPVRTYAATGRPNPAFDAEVRQVGDLVRARDGVAVVYRLAAFVNPQTTTLADLESLAGLEVVATFDDAVVLADPRAAR